MNTDTGFVIPLASAPITITPLPKGQTAISAIMSSVDATEDYKSVLNVELALSRVLNGKFAGLSKVVSKCRRRINTPTYSRCGTLCLRHLATRMHSGFAVEMRVIA
jgi:hypothetical protein